MRILIADDDRVSLRILQKHLSKLGHTVDTADDGTSALSLLVRDAPDVAIIDWMMPGVDGPELCRRLRQKTEDRYVYMILLTTRDSTGDLVRGLDSGADDYLIKPVNLPELEARLRAGQRIIELQRNLIAARERLRQQATQDALTGLLNRGAIFDWAQRALQGAVRDSGGCALLLVDVDHFKHLNDTHGHPVGDEALREIARRLAAPLRPSDGLGRYGGEEFLIALPHITRPELRPRAEEIRCAVSQAPFLVQGQSIAISVSIGAVISDREPRDTFEALLACADRALLQAKRYGRNRVVVEEETTESRGQPTSDGQTT